jgi:hypothetical protein
LAETNRGVELGRRGDSLCLRCSATRTWRVFNGAAPPIDREGVVPWSSVAFGDASPRGAKAEAPPANVEWLPADAGEMPFENAAFDTVVCQFGAMFFPDKPKAFG